MEGLCGWGKLSLLHCGEWRCLNKFQLQLTMDAQGCARPLLVVWPGGDPASWGLQALGLMYPQQAYMPRGMLGILLWIPAPSLLT